MLGGKMVSESKTKKQESLTNQLLKAHAIKQLQILDNIFNLYKMYRMHTGWL